jgi:hypothetical protein
MYINLLPGLQCLARKALLDLSMSLTMTLPDSSGVPDYSAFIFRESADYSTSNGRKAATRHSSMIAVITKLGRAGIVQHSGTVIMTYVAYVRSRNIPTFW